MKLLPEKEPASTPAPSPVIFAPGDYFFVRRFELPAGMDLKEIPGFVALQLEELAPFPLEQLYHGHLRASDGSAVLVYAAYRRRFSAEHQEAWSRATFVLPDFAPALRLEYEQTTIVYWRSEHALDALYFEGGRKLPARIVSRPLAADAPPEAVEAARDQLRTRLGAPAGVVEASYRLGRAPQQRAQGLTCSLQSDDYGAAHELVYPTSECWGMDIRDPAFVAQQRRRLGFDLVLWRVLQGAAALVALLLAGEILLLGFKGYSNWLSNRVRSRADLVASTDNKNRLATSLESFSRNRLQPFEMLSVIRRVQTSPNLVLTNAVAEGQGKLVVSGTAGSIGEFNAFAAALRNNPAVAELSNKPAEQNAQGQTMFDLTITFRPNAFTSAERGPAALAETAAP